MAEKSQLRKQEIEVYKPVTTIKVNESNLVVENITVKVNPDERTSKCFQKMFDLA